MRPVWQYRARPSVIFRRRKLELIHHHSPRVGAPSTRTSTGLVETIPSWIRSSGSAVGLIDSGFSSRRECDAAYINNFKLHRRKPAQPALATLTVVLSLDPRNDR